MAREGSGRSVTRSLAIAVALACASIVVRLLVLRALPFGAWSADLSSWQLVAGLLGKGQNPYDTTTLLNWPPLWMQLLFVIERVAVHTHHSVIRIVQGFLIAVEALVTILVYLVLDRQWQVRRPGLTVLVGLVLNPVAIILTVIHGNFDLIVGLCVVLFLWAIVRWLRGGEGDDWLLACMFLGIGVLAKVTPIVLIPLLLLRWHEVTWRRRALGAVLLIGPAALGLSIIYALGPSQVMANVIHYRSQAGAFGITGLINIFRRPEGFIGYNPPGGEVYSACFIIMLLGIWTAVGWACVTGRLRDRQVVTLVPALLAAIPILGPGYATQYPWWWIPSLVIAFALAGRAFRIATGVLYVVGSCTYALLYGFVPAYGEVLIRLPLHPASWDRLSASFADPVFDTLVSLPLFAAYIAYLATTAALLARSASASNVAEMPPASLSARI